MYAGFFVFAFYLCFWFCVMFVAFGQRVRKFWSCAVFRGAGGGDDHGLENVWCKHPCF